ncbi:vinexin isoform X2 [Hyperolius riggenbachi]|uniref:vinexin isoform X2 n=1 Tax=Hyperolius riggenbachi TaxID=752182 RepID=UPI0035A28D33
MEKNTAGMALDWLETDLPFSLDDFIPPHLQKKERPSQNFRREEEQVVSEGNGQVYKATMVLTSDNSDDTCDSSSPRVERRWIRYDGIGPTDEDGMPFASRSSVDKPREWYRNMFRVLHQLSDSEDSDGENSSQSEDQPETQNFTATSRFQDNQQHKENDQDEPPRRSKETSHLHVTLTSPVTESPSKLNSTSRVQPSLSPSSSLHSTGLSRVPAEERRSLPTNSDRSRFTSSFTSTVTSSNSNSRQPLQTQGSSSQRRQQKSEQTQGSSSQRHQQMSEPVFTNTFSSRPSYTSRVTDLPQTTSHLPSKETTSPKRLDGNKFSFFEAISSDTSNLSPTSKHPWKSNTKMLDQLETDLREFTEELDKELESRKRTESLELCEEVVLRRSSYREDGSPESSLNRSQNNSNKEDSEPLSPMAQGLVKFDFAAHSEKELSLQRGTKVQILKKVDKNWLLGEQNGRRGLFPESYVKVVSPGHYEAADTPQLSAIALYDFKADADSELPLRKGQRVSITRRVGGNWFEGRVEGSARLGLFPANYVQVGDGPSEKKANPKINTRTHAQPVEQVSASVTLKEKPCVVKAPTQSKLQQLKGKLYRAVFNYSPNNTDELQLRQGDVVTVTERCDDGWYVGVCWRTQQFGTFPGNFVIPYVSS